MDPAQRLSRSCILAATPANCDQFIADPISTGRFGRLGPRGAARNRPRTKPTGAGNHRGRLDWRLLARPVGPAPAKGTRGPHRHGRFRDRVLLLVLFAIVPV